MLTVAKGCASAKKGGSGADKYYLELGMEDYYCSGIDPRGTFKGKGAARLGLLNQKIEYRDPRLKNLFYGLSPNGKEVLREGGFQIRKYKVWKYKNPENGKITTFKRKKDIPKNLQDKVVQTMEPRGSTLCYDNVFSAPKPVSILWSLAPNEPTRERIHQAHINAVNAGMKYLEDNSCFIRKGKGGSTLQKSDAIFAVFHHTTSRELDPQLHTHVVMLNIGFNSQGESGALEGGQILSDKHYTAGMIYQNTLRRSLELEFNIKTYDRPFKEGKGISFGIEGIDDELCHEFSQRNKQIQERITADMTPLEVRTEVLASRKDKNLKIQTKDLFKGWQERAERLDFEWDKVVNRNFRHQQLETKQLNQEIATRLHQIPRAQTTQKTAKIKAPAINHSPATPTRGISESQITTATLSAAKGKLSTKQVYDYAQQFKLNYLEPLPTKNTGNHKHNQKVHTPQYRLNGQARKLINHKSQARTLWSKAKTIIEAFTQWHKNRRKQVLINSKSKKPLNQRQKIAFKLKMLYLYSTGKITQKQYLKITASKDMPISKFKIHALEALGLISKRQAYRLMSKYHYDDFWYKHKWQNTLDKVPTIETSYSSKNFNRVTLNKLESTERKPQIVIQNNLKNQELEKNSGREYTR